MFILQSKILLAVIGAAIALFVAEICTPTHKTLHRTPREKAAIESMKTVTMPKDVDLP